MIKFLWQKLWRNKWLTLSLIMGTVLLIGIVAGTPMYMTATRQRIFQQDLREIRNAGNSFPAVMSFRYIFNVVQPDYRLATYYDTRYTRWPDILNEVGITSEMSFRSYIMGTWDTEPVIARASPPRNHQIFIAAAQGFEEHIYLTHGRMPAEELVDGNIIEALALTRTLTNRDMLLDELMVVTHLEPYSEPLFVRVVGVYDIPPESELFWMEVPVNLSHALIISDRFMYEHFVRNYRTEYRMTAVWTDILDFTQMRILDIERYEQVLHSTIEWHQLTRVWMFNQNFLPTLHFHDASPERLQTTLWILQLPIFVMLALFIYMVSRQILLIDRNDISVLQSRGASRAQIIGLYIMQGMFVGVVSFPLGIALGVGMCHILGASNGFLDLVQREALTVFITGEALLFGLAAFGFAFINMFLPVIRFSKIGVVENKLTKSGRSRNPLWQRYFLDILALGAAIYGLYAFGDPEMLAAAALLTEERGIDPLIYLSSSLFIVGAGLLCLRVFPWIVRLVFWIGRNMWTPSIYASMIKVIRSAGEEQFIMLFLIFTVSIGIFSAQAARTINLNNEHLVMYNTGADLTFSQIWDTNVRDGMPPPPRVFHFEPDFTRWARFDEVESITRVMRLRGNMITIGGFNRASIDNIELMGIETRTFGETVWFRDDLLQAHINYFLNVLAVRPNGVLLSSNFHRDYGIEIGDTVLVTEHVNVGLASYGEFIVVGFVDYWPTYTPTTRLRLPSGDILESESFLAIANFGHIETQWGIRPYHVWMNTNTDSGAFILDYISAFNRTAVGGMRIDLLDFSDAMSSLVAIRTDPVVQGTNGVFTVGFIVILIVCFTGFLIYWILSIRSRVLQFGIFRAMGMTMRSIIGLLINEQLFITLTALIIGAIVGELSAYFFVPLIQISFTPADQVIPLLVVMEPQDYRNLFITIAVTVLLCLMVLIGFISRIKIDQALKLGED